MIIPASLSGYIIQYGYGAIFSLIFVQELGVPNPVPNEVILLFAGYLGYAHILNFYLILLAGVSADFIGTTVLYVVFYFFGERVLRRASRFLPMERIENIKQKLVHNSGRAIFIGRLLPYLRGYASVAAGLLRIPPKKFLPSVAASAVLWSGGYVLLGRVLGTEWETLANDLSGWQLLGVVAIVIIVIFFIIPKSIGFIRRKKSNT